MKSLINWTRIEEKEVALGGFFSICNHIDSRKHGIIEEMDGKEVVMKQLFNGFLDTCPKLEDKYRKFKIRGFCDSLVDARLLQSSQNPMLTKVLVISPSNDFEQDRSLARYIATKE